MVNVVPLLRLVSDQRLAEHVAAGSDRAFEVLYGRYHRMLFAFCRSMLGSVEEAEDALQHTFMAAYRELARSGPPPALRPWLFVIARNRCISTLRARREWPTAALPERPVDRLAADVAVRDELRSVFAGLARLPADQRAALVLAELGDLSHEEIAQVLDCRREQVKAYVFQARSALAAERLARDTPCADIREQLAEARGGQLRRTPLRRHLDDCPGCQAFRNTLRAQRRQLRALLPIAPGLGLKRALLAVVSGGSAGGGAAGGFAAKVAIVLAIPAGGVAVAAGDGAPARNAGKVVLASEPAVPAPGSETRRDEAHSRGERPAPKRRRPAPERAKDRGEQPRRAAPAAPRHEDEAAVAPRGDDDAPAAPPVSDDEPLRDTTPPGQDPDRPRGNKPETPPGQDPDRPPGNKPETPPGQDPDRPPANKPGTPPGLEGERPPGQDNRPAPPAHDKPEPGPPHDVTPAAAGDTQRVTPPAAGDAPAGRGASPRG